jgi:hypothetical protein
MEHDYGTPVQLDFINKGDAVLRTFCQEVFSRNSFASLTFDARYGLPPRSGWLSIIIVRCAFRILSLVIARSLQGGKVRLAVSTGKDRVSQNDILEGQDERSLPLVHTGLESSLVKSLA